MKIFVVGGTGYLGSAAVRALVEDGHDVSVLVRSNSSEVKVKEMGAAAVQGDLAELDSYIAPLETADGIVFAASGQGEDWGEVDKRATDVVSQGET